MENNLSAIRLKEARESKNLNLRELEQITGISRSTLNRYEKVGLSNVPIDKIKSLCSALSISEEWLLGKESLNKQFINDLFSILDNKLINDNDIGALEIAHLIQYSKNKQEMVLINNYIETKVKLLNYKGLKELQYYLDYITSRNDLINTSTNSCLDEYENIINIMLTTNEFDIDEFISRMNSTLRKK